MHDCHPIAYASRSVTTTESNYIQIEKELLPIAFGAERLGSYLYDRKFTIESDHKPSAAITKKSVLSASKRLQRMVLRLQRVDFNITYKKGSEMFLLDMLSRSNAHTDKERGDRGTKFDVSTTDDERSHMEREIESINMMKYLFVSHDGPEKVQKATEQDSQSALITLIKDGWPEVIAKVPEEVRCYYSFRDEVTSKNGLIFKGERLVIPNNLKRYASENTP